MEVYIFFNVYILVLVHPCSLYGVIISITSDLLSNSASTRHQTTTNNCNNLIPRKLRQTCKTSWLSDSEFFLSVSNNRDKLLMYGVSFNKAVMTHCFVTSLQLQLNHRTKHRPTSSDDSWSFRRLYSPTVCQKTKHKTRHWAVVIMSIYKCLKPGSIAYNMLLVWLPQKLIWSEIQNCSVLYCVPQLYW